MEPDFEALQRAIDEADEALAKALEARAKAVLAVQEAKASPGRFFATRRDDQVVNTALERVSTVPERGVRAVWREVLSASHALVAPRRVYYLGGAGSFGHLAARQKFGASSEFHSLGSASDVLEALMREPEAFAVLPLETSSDGAVTATLHALARSEAQLCGEVSVPGSYALWAVGPESDDERATLVDVRSLDRVYGTRAALAACEGYLRRELPDATIIDVPTAGDAVDLVAGDSGAAALGSALLGKAALGTSLVVADDGVEDVAGVTMRFALVGRALPSRTGNDRTFVSMALGDEPGALYACLKPLADRGINLTRVESRPAAGGPWRYLFFVEMDGHMTDRSLLTGLEELRAVCSHVRVLGSYPRPV